MDSSLSQPGTIMTFYSYKGGTGRSMALANIACLLGKQVSNSSRRVLAMDWDLEAPGLHRYFPEISGLPEHEARPGVIDYFYSLRKLLDETPDLYETMLGENGWETLENALPLEDYLIPDVQPGVDFIKAGRVAGPEYAELVGKFDWIDFYTRYGSTIRSFTNMLTARYAYSLVDSRTGLTDISGICTMLLPEKLVGVFTPNSQSLYGLRSLIARATDYRRASDDFRPLAVFPLPSRIDGDEQALRQSWRREYQAEFQSLFNEVYQAEECNLTEYFDNVQLPHRSFYAYGEKLAVLEEPNEANSLHRAIQDFYQRLVELDYAWQKPGEVETLSPARPVPDDDEAFRRLRLGMQGRKAFVPHYENDIFVSYAHVDDQPVSGADQGWVANLVQGLKTSLAQRLGRDEGFTVWMADRDYGVPGNVRIASGITNAIQQSATLLIILSPGYLASEWCRQESNTFLQLVKARQRSGSSVFIVECDDVRRPQEFQDLLGYQFWEEDQLNKVPRRLGWPKPDRQEPGYYDMVLKLSNDLITELQRLRTLQEGSAVEEHDLDVDDLISHLDGPPESSIQIVEAANDYFVSEIHSQEFHPILLLGCGGAGNEMAGIFRLKPDYVPAYLPEYYPVRAIAMDTQANISDLLSRAVGWYEPHAQLHMNPPDEGLIEGLLERGVTQQDSPGESHDQQPIQSSIVGRGGGAGGFTLRGRATALYHFGSDNGVRQINTDILDSARLLSRANAGYLLTFSGLGGGTGSGAVPVVAEYLQQRLQPSPLATFSVCVVPERTSAIITEDNARSLDTRLRSNLVCALYYLAKCNAINGIILSDNLQIESQGHKGFRLIDQHLQEVLMPLFLSSQAHYVNHLGSPQLDPINLRLAMAPGEAGTQDFNVACYSVASLSQARQEIPATDGQTVAIDPGTGVPDLRNMLEVALRNPTIHCENGTARGVLALLSGPTWALKRMVPDVLALTDFDQNVLFSRCIDSDLQSNPNPDTFSRFFVADFSQMNEVRLTVLLRAPRMRGLENALREGLMREAPEWVPGAGGGTLADDLRRVDEDTIRRIGWSQANPMAD